jgi:hypothetical protein
VGRKKEEREMARWKIRVRRKKERQKLYGRLGRKPNVGRL